MELDLGGAALSGAVGQDLEQHSAGREATDDMREAELVRRHLLVPHGAHRRAFLLLNPTAAVSSDSDDHQPIVNEVPGTRCSRKSATGRGR